MAHDTLSILATAERLEALKALREVLAETIVASNSARDVAALSRQIREVIADIEKIENGIATPDTGLAALDRRRADRGLAPRRV